MSPPENLTYFEYCELQDLITRDCSPLFYYATFEDYDNNPTMSMEAFYDIQKKYAENPCDYLPEDMLNHGWVGKIKEMMGWEPGNEIIFSITSNDLCGGGGGLALMYNLDRDFPYNHKIDAEGYLCSVIPIPVTRRHLHENERGHYLFYTPIQRVLCWYNIELEMSQYSYVLK